MTRSFAYIVTVEYSGTIELDDDDLAEYVDDDDMKDALDEQAIDEALSGFAGGREVIESDVTETVSA